MRKITRIEPSEMFWKDLAELRRESWYEDLRASLAKFILDASEGNAVNERGFSNPKLKGLLHISLPGGQRLFHTYTDGNCLKLCMIVDHKRFGFNGKNKSREAETANRAWRAAEDDVMPKPLWPDFKWKEPRDIIKSPEVLELSMEALSTLLDQIEEETSSLSKLLRKLGKSDITAITDEEFDEWADGLILSHERVCRAIEEFHKENDACMTADAARVWMEL